MMRENTDPRDAGREGTAHQNESARQLPQDDPATTDREVPLAAPRTPEAIHAWLDCEAVNDTELHADDRAYQFWSKVQDEAGRRRRMNTPAHVSAQIMSAIKKG